MYYGYVRVSSREQNEGRQIDALKKYEVDKRVTFETIFIDKASGKNFERLQYKALKKLVLPGDVIVIKELDRLGRNEDYEEIKKELIYFNNRNIKVVILDLPVFNIDDPSLNKLLNNLVIELLSYIAHKEREKIIQRVNEGLKRAKQQGKKLGRPKRTLPKEFEKYYIKWQSKEINGVEFAKLLNISRTTLYRYIKLYRSKYY